MTLNKVHVTIASILFFIVGYFTSSSTIEIVSAVSGLLCVWLAAKESIWSYPIGFVNIAAFMYIFWGAGLYADFTLQILFAALSAYGWVYWLKGKGNHTVKPTKRVTTSEIILYIVITIVGTFLWANFNLMVFHGVALPYFDAFVAILSVIAQIMLSRKRLENWYVWIVVDVLSIWMYWYKDLHLLSLLYVFFLVNAVYGLIAWKSEFRKLQEERMINKMIKNQKYIEEQTPWVKFITEHQGTYYTTDDPENPFNKGGK
jgi:nicotinamide mononucleotide transporter